MESVNAGLSDVARRAVAEADRLHNLGYNCAESVLGGVAEALGLDGPPLRIATGFGGGVGRTGEICGAVTGAVMVMGWARGRNTPEEKEAYASVSLLVRKFLADFRAAHETLQCSALTGFDFSDPGMLPKFAADPVRREKCGGFIRTAARLAAEALAGAPNPGV